MGTVKNIAGKRFGLRVAVRFAGMRSGKAVWLCRCDCGTEKDTSVASLRSSKSCGCLQSAAAAARRTHGHSSRRGGETRTYRIWKGMLTRCHNPRAPQWRKYGARGIAVCAAWRGSFSAFLADMGEAPHGRSIDRVDGAGHYEPGNCRWATATEQALNTRRNRLITVGDRTQTLSQWSAESGVDRGTIASRLKAGVEPESAVFLPPAVNQQKQSTRP